MATKRNRPGKKAMPDDAERAIILSHAATFGVGSAAKEFKVSRRTIERYRADIRAGNNPKLAALVATESERAKERNRSKLHRALDAFLDRAIELAPKADVSKTLEGVTRIGDLVTKRQVFFGDDELDGRDPGASPHEGAGSGVPREPREESEPVH
jgi:hypothetical protein